MLLWPGLPQIWYRGPWIGLAKAVGAAVLLNVVLLGSFGWAEQMSSGLRSALWISVGVFWGASALAGYLQTRRQTKRKQVAPAKDTYPQAMDCYLKGDSFQTECLLVDLLARNERDLDARMMLATLYRHARRYEEAIKQLDLLVRCDGSEKWQVEMERERTLIEEGIRAGKDWEEPSGGTIRMDETPIAA
jgi:hypothetical protein